MREATNLPVNLSIMKLLKAATRVLLIFLILGITVRLVLSISAVFTLLNGQPEMIASLIVRFVGDLLILAVSVYAYRLIARRNKKVAVS